MNKVILIGNLTADPELSTTNSGVSVCKFSIAVRRKVENSEGERVSDFFNIVAWKTQADLCGKYLKKGNRCCITGRLQNNSYEDKNGIKRYATNIMLEDVDFIFSNKAEDKEQQAKNAQAELLPIDDDDSLPF